MNFFKKLENEFLNLLFLSIPNICLSCSEAAGKAIFRHRDFTVIKNGIKISKYTFSSQIRMRVRSELHIENKFVIGHIGRFVYPKNHIFLVDIFDLIYRVNKNCVLLLVGSGETMGEIKEKVHNLGLEDAVYFYGTTSTPNELYQAMDCFVFPSHFEGLGIVAIEAQAAGLKTLCADTIPQEACITDLFEYMSLEDDPQKWAEKILSYNDGYERKDMSEIIKNAGYDIVDSVKQLENLYLKISN